MMTENEELTLYRELFQKLKHDIKSSLSVVNTTSFTLKEDNPKSSNMLRGASKEIENLVQSLELFFNIPNQNTEYFATEDIQLFIEKELKPLAEEKNLDLHVEIENFLVKIPAKFINKAIIFQMLDNAIKFSTQKSKISFKVFKTADAIIFEVQDQADNYEKNISECHITPGKSYSKDGVEGFKLGLPLLKVVASKKNGELTWFAPQDKIFTNGLKLSLDMNLVGAEDLPS
jgi:K+-sensing histidine kinase KdpD